MDADRLRTEINESLLRFIAGVVLHNQVVAQRVGLGASDSQFVSLLGLHGPLTPGRLAELSGLTTGTVTGVLDRLERAGYVRRRRDATDRRKVVVEPVPEAMTELSRHFAAHGRHADAVLRRRDPDQLRVIAEFLAELTADPGGDRPSDSRRGGGPDTAPGGTAAMSGS
jgi:DNA-binding MarR family transcriptional regulator